MLKKLWLIVASFALSGFAHAFYPETGTWVFLDEENGKPGRGLTLDVQNGILVATVYGYEDNGQPTFYTGVGKLEFVSVLGYLSASEVNVTVELKRYTGGRSFGSAAREAVEAGSVGQAQFRFIHGTLGYVTLPKEQSKRITRYVFGVTKNTVEDMLGTWFISETVNSYGWSEAVHFNEIKMAPIPGRGSMALFAISHNGRMKCREGLPEDEYVSGGTGLYVNRIEHFSSNKTCYLMNDKGDVVKTYNYIYMGTNHGLGRLYDGGSTYMVYFRRLVDGNGNMVDAGLPTDLSFGP